ncbi:Crp/Fnr family transcriptional regulator [Umezakia ovalisporum]|jgi:CRP-like cAMP-binding protein|uniref:Crp/Fnr family transcriptional regulator n=2 Tax=Umezakia ovalisporum TaxID=75695 RepID=A0AA43H0K0_9CYAN|nr:Crp/Fnr family transcriptional regulator [Umezakia ovalisporum]MBI1240077.1 helix-turn-helix domain-containing protein [Nostoc sp. RI_552]MDH6056989.1 Crp/Fnr family transcriptional regulator [Umezakia ovalisporum FSS-43]MDH6064445.1 Crp/Fnr family transcriptional regulator [Umezakia ovalisporum FSS-62]MDH6068439.1 Crp/Fnr family transcriptional regulator [Umezakia ovalisporum APH033B]MDH6071180.1 Crp/Fnr family transcriptional regulator [Umezakia ovalisporum CobakiLakeA]
MSTTNLTPNLSNVSNEHNATGDLPQRLFTRKELIPPRNDVLWRIERGAVRTLTWNEEGIFVTLGYWGAGDVIGYSLSKVQPYNIECLTSVEASIIPSHLWYRDIDAFLSHIKHSEELLSIVHIKPMSLRLGKFLLWLSEKFGRDVEQGKLVDLNITHQEISEVLNTTRVTVTRMLQQFEEQGALLRYKRRIIIISTNKLIKGYHSIKK